MEIKKWMMDYEEHKNLKCEAPCSMYSVLLEHGLMEDPFYGLNELTSTDYSDKNCTFVSTFEVGRELLQREHIEVTFEGLDTICRIYCNEKLLDAVNNMHCGYTYDLKEYLVPGVNSIRLEFQSPTRYFKERNARHYIWNGSDCIEGAAHLRKALYMSGWDWGPKLPDMGIFRPVKLKAYDTDRIEDVMVIQHHGEDYVELEITVSSRHHVPAEYLIEIAGQQVRTADGSCRIRIEHPRLWWVRGYGEPYLYDLSVTMLVQNQMLDTVKKRIGLRTITVSTAKDSYGSEFCFVVNGVKIFAMGANYIPQDNILSRISKERTDRLLNDCVEANFNCIRVWGGGYYPEDDFYDLCDEKGLLVWQDFMVACANVWLTKEFEENIIREAVYNIKRLRHHASLGLLCGNNEMEEAVTGWDIAKDSALVKADYLRLYEHILPDLVDRYAPQTFYWPSSPSCGGGFDDPTDTTRGDVHYWKVWHGNAPFTDYRKFLFRFCSEYGFESFPSVKTIQTFCEKQDWNAFSRVMENHQKCKSGNGKIVNYISQNYLYPASFEKLVYTSQLLQAEAVKYGVEHFRRIRGICMGSIYWQVNDCWPVASWSSIDYYGRYKALHYAAKKFYAPVAMGLFLEEDILTVNVSNETRKAFHGYIHYRLCENDFTVIEEKKAEVTVEPLSSLDGMKLPVHAKDRYCNYIAVTLYDETGREIMEQTELLTKPKYYEFEKPHISVVFTEREEGVELAVTSDYFAKAVEVDFANADCVLSDNFFDIVSADPKKILAKTGYSADELKENLIIRSVYDIG